jgi:hypothetical protein
VLLPFRKYATDVFWERYQKGKENGEALEEQKKGKGGSLQFKK